MERRMEERGKNEKERKDGKKLVMEDEWKIV